MTLPTNSRRVLGGSMSVEGHRIKVIDCGTSVELQVRGPNGGHIVDLHIRNENLALLHRLLGEAKPAEILPFRRRP